LTKNNMAVLPYPPYFSLPSHLKIKLKGRRFYTAEVLGAESQAMQTPPQNTTSWMRSKKWQERWNWRIRAEEENSPQALLFPPLD
jgi:hypothetical protein